MPADGRHDLLDVPLAAGLGSGHLVQVGGVDADALPAARPAPREMCAARTLARETTTAPHAADAPE